MFGQTYRQTDTHTHTHTHETTTVTLSAHARRGLMKALKCKPSAQFIYNYSINVLSKFSNIISHRSSKVNTSIIDLQRSAHRSSKVNIDHRSSKVDTSTIDFRRSTSISECRQIDLRKSTHRSSKVDTSIFEDRRQKHRTDNPKSNRILSSTALLSIIL